MGEVYSHLSEEERQVIQIEIGNGTSIRRIGLMLGRNASTVSREVRRNTWFPSNENESYRPYRPKRLKTSPWTGGYYIAGPAQRKADRRRAGHASRTGCRTTACGRGWPNCIPSNRGGRLGVVPFCWTPLFLFSDYATKPSSRLRSMMLVPYSILILLSRYQIM